MQWMIFDVIIYSAMRQLYKDIYNLYILRENSLMLSIPFSIIDAKHALNTVLLRACIKQMNDKTILYGSVWIELIITKTENWKYCSKIIFKYVNSIMRSIYSEKVVEKWILWVLWIVYGTHWCALFTRKSQQQRLQKEEKKNANAAHKRWIQTPPKCLFG